MISKRGNGYLRKILFQIGWSLYMNNDEYRAVYMRMRARGKNYKTCIIALARKFLRFLFAFFWKQSTLLGASANADRALSRQGSIEPLRVSPHPGNDRLRTVHQHVENLSATSAINSLQAPPLAKLL